MTLQEGGSHKILPSRKKRAEIDEGWVRGPGDVGWVYEADVRGWDCGVSLADTDYECIHGRLRGDACPQPATVPGYNDKPVPNQDRRWEQPYPCDCWGETRVKTMPTPDPFAAVRTVKTMPTPDPFAPARTAAQGGPPGREPVGVRG